MLQLVLKVCFVTVPSSRRRMLSCWGQPSSYSRTARPRKRKSSACFSRSSMRYLCAGGDGSESAARKHFRSSWVRPERSQASSLSFAADQAQGGGTCVALWFCFVVGVGIAVCPVLFGEGFIPCCSNKLCVASQAQEHRRKCGGSPQTVLVAGKA